MTNHSFDAVIIGGGAAGLSAAQALGRSLRRTLVLDGGAPRNRFAAHMHNVLGGDGVPPLELAARGRAEAQAYGVEFADGDVLAVRESADGLTIEFAEASASVGADGGADGGADTGSGSGTEGERTVREIAARVLIVASGVRDELPAIPGLAEHWGSTVLHCPYCHGWEVRGERLGVLAVSPLSMHQAKLIRQWSDRVTVFSAGLGVLDEETARVLRSRDVVIEPSPVTEVLSDGERVSGVRTASGAEHAIDAIFTGGTLVPRDEFLAGLALDRAETPVGSFIAVDQGGRTSHPRIWAAGNVVMPMATVPIAMGAGAQAGGAANYALVEEDFALAAASA